MRMVVLCSAEEVSSKRRISPSEEDISHRRPKEMPCWSAFDIPSYAAVPHETKTSVVYMARLLYHRSTGDTTYRLGNGAEICIR